MSLRYQKKRGVFGEINIVPYVDVTLVLLLVFMISAPLIEQGVDVKLPKANAKTIDTVSQEPIVITINAKAELFLNLSDTPKKSMEVRNILARVIALRKVYPDVPVLVRGDRKTYYGNVVKTMAMLQSAGIEHVGLITESQSQ